MHLRLIAYRKDPLGNLMQPEGRVLDERKQSEEWRGYAPSLKYMPTVPVVVGVGKEGRTLIRPWGYLNRKLPFIELP